MRLASAKRLTVVAVFALLLCCDLGTSEQSSSPFELGEISVVPSLSKSSYWLIPERTQVLDFDVSPFGPEVAALIRDGKGAHSVVFWHIGSNAPANSWTPPSGFQPRSLNWHPSERRFFLAGTQDHLFQIIRVEAGGGQWQARTIYSSSREIRRILVGPRPFFGNESAYRLFFGEMTAGSNFAIMSITEQGKSRYQVVGPKAGIHKKDSYGVTPSEIESDWALPVSFHPSGSLMLWEDKAHEFHKAVYGRSFWDKSVPLLPSQLSAGSVTVTPNGAALIHWRSGMPGVELYFQQGNQKVVQAADFTFLTTPSSVPDGKGIVGLTKSPEGTRLIYVPLEIPLADVANAWMFLESPTDADLFSEHGGLFRDLGDDQLYSIYESEAYYCGDYDESTPTRPYLVTTDIFWELFASAYEGMFIIRERYDSIPAFWSFVQSAQNSLQSSDPRGLWNKIFSTLTKIYLGSGGQDPEVTMILKAEGRKLSTILDKELNYGDLKPRGHYASDVDLSKYFRAVRYLTEVVDQTDTDKVQELRTLPASVSAKALEWIRTYQPFVAPSRGPVIWDRANFSPPVYARHPSTKARAFPLSWGFDNEVLLSSVYHENWPAAERIEGSGGKRLVPSGLDLAAALGNNWAGSLLNEQFGKYPPLREVLNALQIRFKSQASVKAGNANLYQLWINALSKQWAEDIVDSARKGNRIWRSKKLQTGLASWTTLRHATVLVNERTAAECGEAGFEEILYRPPRGAVEPDPATFGAIAALFEAAGQLASTQGSLSRGSLPTDGSDQESLRQGILKRLSETAAKARMFQKMAEKQVRGTPFTNQEYEEILYVGRVAEHNLLVFKSLANKELALSNPDPVSKIVEVSGGTESFPDYLLSAVGKPMEWDWIVPYYGRREIVKGSVYSYYEFLSPTPMTDLEWRERLSSNSSAIQNVRYSKQTAGPEHPEWIKPFISRMNLSCPPRAPF